MSDILSGIVKGISGFLPQDDPDVKIFNAQNKLKDLSTKEEAAFARFGRMVFEKQGANDYPNIISELERLTSEKKAAEESLRLAKEEKNTQERAKAEEAARSCPNCGSNCPEGTNFCPECGTKLLAPAPAGKRFCTSCGTEITPGSAFCTSCGTRADS